MLRSRGRLALVSAALAHPLAEDGHGLAKVLRYGNAGIALQTSGMHSYFPPLLIVGGGGLGTILLAALAILAAAKAVAGRRRALEVVPTWPVHILILLLFIWQMEAFALQEASERIASGAGFDGFAGDLFWGAVGQGPLAILAGTALRWISARLEPAARELQVALDLRLPALSATPLSEFHSWLSCVGNEVESELGSAFGGKRAPPVAS